MYLTNQLYFKPHPKDLQILNTFGLNSIALSFLRISDISQLQKLSNIAKLYSCISILGGGSNIVFPKIVKSLIVKVELFGINILKENRENLIIEVAAGESWHSVVARCITNGWSGLENLALIPGTVGAAPVQNIGAYGMELSDCLYSLNAWNIRTGYMVHMNAKDCNFSYRNSIFKQKMNDHDQKWLIVSICLILSKFWKPELKHPDLKNFFKSTSIVPRLKDVFDAICRIRRAKLPDPAIFGNVGSFFKNPIVSIRKKKSLSERFKDLPFNEQNDGYYKISAGYLIEKSGWKGKKQGGVAVSKKNPLVLINLGNATADEVIKLSNAIRIDIKNKFGIILEIEPTILS